MRYNTLVKIAITGHRPHLCEDEAVVRLKGAVKLRYTPDARIVITGMADGVDLWFADEARLLGLELWAVRPWDGHAPGPGFENLYQEILSAATKTVVISPEMNFPGNWCYFKRNEWMVDHADCVLAYLRPDVTRGGTLHCRNYAKEKGKPVKNVFFDPPF